MKFDGVIFDMDGLLMDSERYSLNLCVKLFNEMGVPYSEEEYMKTVGLTHADCDRIMLEYLNGDSEKVKQLNQGYGRAIIDAYEKGLVPLKPGAYELINYLKQQNIPYVLATSSPRDRVAVIFNKTEFNGNPFTKVITGNEVTNGKPAPEIFLKAADMIGKDIKKCLVLEDSYNGVRAGHSSGAYTIMVPDLKQPTEEIKALCNDIVEDLFKVIEILKEN